METQTLTSVKKETQSIQLVKGEFTLSEASLIVSSLIDEKINFHKIQRLQIWEGDHQCKTKHLDGRILELEKERLIAKEFINSLRGVHEKLNIEGTLKISITK